MCAGKDSYAEAHDWKQCLKQGRLRAVYVSPWSLSPRPCHSTSQLYSFLLSPCKVAAAEDRPSGEPDLLVPAQQRSLLPKAHVPTLKSPFPEGLQATHATAEKTREAQRNWDQTNQSTAEPETSLTLCRCLLCQSSLSTGGLLPPFRQKKKKKSLLSTKWLGSKHKTAYCYSQIHRRNKCSSF